MTTSETLDHAENSARPWSNWESPKVHNFTLSDLIVTEKNGELELQVPNKKAEGELVAGYTIGNIDNTSILQSLGLYAGFPADFVGKLASPRLKAEVISERLSSAGERQFQSVSLGDSVISLANSKRDIIDAKKIADMAYDTLNTMFPELSDVQVSRGNGLSLRMMTPRNDEITGVVGDVLNYGLKVQYTYGNEISVQLLSNRLICTNGAYHTDSHFSWRSNDNKTEAAQLQFVASAIQNMTTRMDEVTAHSRKMAETPFEGNWQDALTTRLNAMRVPRAQHQRIFDQFQIEPGETEWSLVNAITRFASHGEGLSDNFRQSLQTSSGTWAAEFDLVTCRMPRALAMRAHATIIEEPVLS